MPGVTVVDVDAGLLGCRGISQRVELAEYLLERVLKIIRLGDDGPLLLVPTLTCNT